MKTLITKIVKEKSSPKSPLANLRKALNEHRRNSRFLLSLLRYRKISSWEDVAREVPGLRTRLPVTEQFRQGILQSFLDAEETRIRQEALEQVDGHYIVDVDSIIDDVYNTKDSKIESDFSTEPNNLEIQLYIDPRQAFIDKFRKEYSINTLAKQEHNLAGQITAAAEICYNLFHHPIKCHKADCLQGDTGHGKTFVMGDVFHYAINIIAWHKLVGCYSHMPYIVITRASVVEQTRRVLSNLFHLDCVNILHVINIDSLRSALGEQLVGGKFEIEHGQDVYKWHWHRATLPSIIWIDERQVLKNENSQQSRIMSALADSKAEYGNLPYPLQIEASATPWARVSEAKCFTVATEIPITFGSARDIKIDNKTWNLFANDICGPRASPYDFSPAAMKRYMEHMKEHVVFLRGIKSKFPSRNRVVLLQFKTAKERLIYDLAMERYLEECRKAGKESPKDARFLILVAKLKFRMAAELIRAEQLADIGAEDIKNGYAPIFACCFKATIAKIVSSLITRHNIPRSDISLIWGGDASFKPKKHKLTEEEKQSIIDRIISGELIPPEELEALQFDTLTPEEEELNKMLEGLDLGIQSRKARQKNIDDFQHGKSKVCLFTFASGGVGLSLHHEYDYTRPRRLKLTPVYNPMEFIQGMGRGHRVTSLSETIQEVFFYADTEEVNVANILSMKLKSMKQAVYAKEQWDDLLFNQAGKRARDRDSSPPRDLSKEMAGAIDIQAEVISDDPSDIASTEEEDNVEQKQIER